MGSRKGTCDSLLLSTSVSWLLPSSNRFSFDPTGQEIVNFYQTRETGRGSTRARETERKDDNKKETDRRRRGTLEKRGRENLIASTQGWSHTEFIPAGVQLHQFLTQA